MNLWKKIKITTLIGLTGVMCVICLYHNNAFYNSVYIKNKNAINTLDWLAEKTDVIGGVSNVFNGINDSNVIEFNIDEIENKELLSGINKHPRQNKWTTCQLNINGEYKNVKIKLHGSDHPHFQNEKYSYKIKSLNNDCLINGWNSFNLIKGEEGTPAIGAINSLARDFGLISSYGKMVILKINNKNRGHYYLVEKIDEEFINDQFCYENTTIIRNSTNWSRKEGVGTHMTGLDFYLGHIKHRNTTSFNEAIVKFSDLQNIIDSSKVKNLGSYFDFKYIGKYLALASVFNDCHFFTGDNLKLVFDSKTNKFYPIYRAESYGRRIKKNINYSKTIMNFDKFLFDSYNTAYSECLTSKLFKLLLSHPKVLNERNKSIGDILASEESFISKIDAYYEENENVQNHSDAARRSYCMLKNRQLNIVKTSFSFMKEYLEYAHIYGINNIKSKSLDLQLDCFSRLKIYYQDTLRFNGAVSGIRLNSKLDLNYVEHSFNYSGDFNPNKLIFVNEYNQDTIDSRFINIIPLSK